MTSNDLYKVIWIIKINLVKISKIAPGLVSTTQDIKVLKERPPLTSGLGYT